MSHTNLCGIVINLNLRQPLCRSGQGTSFGTFCGNPALFFGIAAALFAMMFVHTLQLIFIWLAHPVSTGAIHVQSRRSFFLTPVVIVLL